MIGKPQRDSPEMLSSGIYILSYVSAEIETYLSPYVSFLSNTDARNVPNPGGGRTLISL